MCRIGSSTVQTLVYQYTGNLLANLSVNGTSGSYAYDNYGNMLADSRKALNFEYNFLNLLAGVTKSGNQTVTYTYASDGTKLSVTGADGNGYEYYGNSVYQRKGSSLTFESAGFYEGRVTAGGAYYYLKDHLGSIRVVLDQTGAVKEQNDYYPFGLRQERSGYALLAGNRYKYNGKEEQSIGGSDYLDYGARMYDPATGRWTGIDPMAEKYYGFSPYAYAAGNPCLYIDPTGTVIKHAYHTMSSKEREKYEDLLKELRNGSEIFETLYTTLENSKEVYVVRFGLTSMSTNGERAHGEFKAETSGKGGTITFLTGYLNLMPAEMSEEYFHAFQQDNLSGYDKGEFNREFEAKIAAAAIGAETGGISNFENNNNFQANVHFGDYGQKEKRIVITPEAVFSEAFLNDYYKAANEFADYNITNKIGKASYRRKTTVNPYGLQLLIKKTYEK